MSEVTSRETGRTAVPPFSRISSLSRTAESACLKKDLKIPLWLVPFQ